MSRNQSGNFSLPLPPVNPGDVVESQWANLTLGDIGEALTQSLDRSGRGPMLAPLILAPGAPTQSLEAVSKSYVDSFLSYATGMPVGSITAFGGTTGPIGWLLCNGQAVSRTTYANLFAAIGTTYGVGDGTTTFNVPDLRDQFIRGKNDTRALGSVQAASFAAHTHIVSDPTHAHSASQTAHDHTITTGSHSHGVNDPGHYHAISEFWRGSIFTGANANGNPGFFMENVGKNTEPSQSYVSIQAAGNLGGSADARQPAVTVNGAATGISIGSSGGSETVPQNMALAYYIKAESDTTGGNTVVAITSSDSNMVAIDETNPAIPELLIKSNLPFGIPKLDASGKVLLSQLPQGASVLLGYFDASQGGNPSQEFPATNYSNGEMYIISVGGTIPARNPATGVESQTVVAVGGTLLYLEGQSQPDGWYYSIPVAASSAANISFLPEGTISSTNVQAAIAELDTEVYVALNALSASVATKQNSATAVTKDSATGGAYIPSGTTLERPAAPVYGQQRANSTLNSQEWWNGTAWVPMGGGATGGAGNGFVYENDIHVTQNYTLTTNKNGMSAGPIVVDDGATVTVPNGSVWSIV